MVLYFRPRQHGLPGASNDDWLIYMGKVRRVLSLVCGEVCIDRCIDRFKDRFIETAQSNA